VVTAVDSEAQQLRDMITGGWRTRVIHAAVQAGLIDALESEERTADAIAAELELHADTVLRVLRGLAACGLCRHLGGRSFAEAPLGRRLRTGASDSMRGLALHWGGRTMAQLETLAQSLVTGEPGAGHGDFAGFLADPVQGDAFCRAMAEQSVPVARALAAAFDFSPFDTVMDVGGGYGGVLAEVLRAHRALKGEIYDLEVIAAGAHRYLADAGVGERARFVVGNFFEHVPAGADCLILKFILHDWSDEEAATIMANCRAALPAGGTVVIVEKLLPKAVGVADESVVRSDMIMLPVNGKERTLDEYRTLAAAAGFAFDRHLPLVDDCHAAIVRAEVR
jgi:hypothetical protein